MITTYDLESFSTIDLEEPVVTELTPDIRQATELRLQTVTESVYAQATSAPDFMPVIGEQLLANFPD